MISQPKKFDKAFLTKTLYFVFAIFQSPLLLCFGQKETARCSNSSRNQSGSFFSPVTINLNERKKDFPPFFSPHNHYNKRNAKEVPKNGGATKICCNIKYLDLYTNYTDCLKWIECISTSRNPSNNCPIKDPYWTVYSSTYRKKRSRD